MNKNQKKVAIIGLGYVGLPLACLCAKKGYKVIGIEINQTKVDLVNEGKNPIKDEYIDLNLRKGMNEATTDNSKLKEADIVIVCVPTPVDGKHVPDLSYVKTASNSIAKCLQENQIITVESTVYPGTTEEIVKPILEKSGKKFFLAHCPERIDPGNKKWTVENIPRVVGGINNESTRKIADFYRSIIDGEVTEVKSSKEAEATKIMENTFRDINIAFMNEMAKSFDKAGIDITEVIKGASSKPFGFLPHYPGAGVGGHCIAVDPYYLIDNAKKYDFDHEFLKLARKINNSMPEHTVNLFVEELNKLGKAVSGAKVGVLGIAYKKDIDDTRKSPALKVINLLKKKGADVVVYDPFVPDKSNVNSLSELCKTVDYFVLITDHSEFKTMDYNLLKNIKLIIDGRNCLDKKRIESLGIKHKGIGR